MAERDGTYDEQIDGSLTLDFSIHSQATAFVATEAPLNDLAVLPQRRAEAANQLLLDLIHQFAVADLLQPVTGCCCRCCGGRGIQVGVDALCVAAEGGVGADAAGEFLDRAMPLSPRWVDDVGGPEVGRELSVGRRAGS
ncbi:hypothetical protein StrepF001_12560 [Streptomyces sp. F001]|uniref:hypothetical protein n=1 Tax=Streptomyces sp. F001 TaxID=1510026 RepID=UPI00101E79E9|nr:hypothetical protein [Streptomyces sp. F001]RZB19572.1 hypothetical protein StrepF001_12560 [Streptomyces sp. F001]